MSELSKSYIITTLSQLGSIMLERGTELMQIIENEHYNNAWFTTENVMRAAETMGRMLNKNDLDQWMETVNSTVGRKSVGLVLAGNIPMVGFHDVLCVLASGNNALIKTSSQDSRLIPWLLKQLSAIAPEFGTRYSFVERLVGFDAVIATGSNNTSRYFDYYFAAVPHIIRKNRNSVAFLTGKETPDQLQLLGHDIFDYFGLGCRNVSKLFVPADYDFSLFFEGIESFQSVINHHKYNNNYDYNKSIYLVNLAKHLDNGFLLLKEDEKMASSLAVVFYETYEDQTSVEENLSTQQEAIQCVVSAEKLNFPGQLVNFGESQQPRLWDYADGVNTMDFLRAL